MCLLTVEFRAGRKAAANRAEVELRAGRKAADRAENVGLALVLVGDNSLSIEFLLVVKAANNSRSSSQHALSVR